MNTFIHFQMAVQQHMKTKASTEPKWNKQKKNGNPQTCNILTSPNSENVGDSCPITNPTVGVWTPWLPVPLPPPPPGKTSDRRSSGRRFEAHPGGSCELDHCWFAPIEIISVCRSGRLACRRLLCRPSSSSLTYSADESEFQQSSAPVVIASVLRLNTRVTP